MIVACSQQVRVTATFPLAHRCPFRDETDNGTAEITWTTAGSTIELHALAKLLRSYADEALSHEDVTGRIAEALGLPGLVAVAVVTRWVTGGAAVVVRAGDPE